ncbi:MAG: hypothetical protein ACLT40_00845, partial [Fusobacterium sp.]
PKEEYEYVKKEVNKYLENNNLELIKMSKRGKVAYVVVKDKNENVYGLKVLIYMTYLNKYVLHIKICEEESLGSRLFNLKELLLFTNKNNINTRFLNLIRVRNKLIREQIEALKGIGKKVETKVKTGDIIKFDLPVEFMNGIKKDTLKYIGRNKFVPVDAIDDSLIYKITNFKKRKFEIINENCK